MKKLFAFLFGVLVFGMALGGLQVYNSLILSGIPIDGDYPTLSIDNSGNVYKNELVGASAHLTGAKTLITTSASVNYPIPGPFENDIASCFYASGTDMIVYGCNSTTILIGYSSSITTDTDNVTITTDILINGTSDGHFKAFGSAPKTTTSLNLAAYGTLSITSGTTIQLVAQSDVPGASLRFDSYSTFANRFY